MANRAEWSSADGERARFDEVNEWAELAALAEGAKAKEAKAERSNGFAEVERTGGLVEMEQADGLAGAGRSETGPVAGQADRLKETERSEKTQAVGRPGAEETLGVGEAVREDGRDAMRALGGRAMKLAEEGGERRLEGMRRNDRARTDTHEAGRGRASTREAGASQVGGWSRERAVGQAKVGAWDSVRGSERKSGPERAGEWRGERRGAPSTISSVQLTETDFADVYPRRKIEADLRYVQDRKERFRDTPQSPRAKAVERAFVRGVQMNRWLGNLSDETGKVSFSTRTHETTKYDDYLHRVDAFTVLRFRDEIETDSGRKLRSVPLGFDVTTSGTRKTVWDKITHAYNDAAELPFGFSHLDYFTDGKRKGALGLLPRYVIGVSANESKKIEDQLRLGMTTKASSEKLATMRFKVLAEIRAQNELFQAMLPDDAYESDDETVQLAQAYIEVADEQLNRALAICTDDLVKYRHLPDKVLEKIKQAQNPFKTRKIVEEYFLEKGREDAEKRRRTEEDWTDPFVQIMACTRELTQAAYDETQPKRLRRVNARRRVMAHDHQLTLPELEGST